MLLCNAFSLNMLAATPASVQVTELTLAQVQALVAEGFESGVGHADTAAVFGQVLGVEVPANRTTISLASGQEILVGQYRGPRLPEGATSLPEGATIQWLRVAVS